MAIAKRLLLVLKADRSLKLMEETQVTITFLDILREKKGTTSALFRVHTIFIRRHCINFLSHTKNGYETNSKEPCSVERTNLQLRFHKEMYTKRLLT